MRGFVVVYSELMEVGAGGEGVRRRFGNRLARSTCDEGAAVGVLIDDALSISYTPCSESAHDRARRLIPHRTPCM